MVRYNMVYNVVYTMWCTMWKYIDPCNVSLVKHTVYWNMVKQGSSCISEIGFNVKLTFLGCTNGIRIEDCSSIAIVPIKYVTTKHSNKLKLSEQEDILDILDAAPVMITICQLTLYFPHNLYLPFNRIYTGSFFSR